MARIAHILGVLSSTAHPMTAGAIADDLDIHGKKRRQVNQVLIDLLKQGRVEKRLLRSVPEDLLPQGYYKSKYIWSMPYFNWDAWLGLEPEALEAESPKTPLEDPPSPTPQQSANQPDPGQSVSDPAEYRHRSGIMEQLRRFAYDKKIDRVIEQLKANGRMPPAALFTEAEVRFRILSVAFERGIATFNEEVKA